MDYLDRLISTEQAIRLVKDNYIVAVSEGQGTPAGFLSRFHEINDVTTGVRLFTCRMQKDFPFLHVPNPTFSVSDSFITKFTRGATTPTFSYNPTHLSKAGRAILANGAPDIFVMTCSLPNGEGKVSTGLSGVYNKSVAKASKILIAELNANMPFTYGDGVFDLDEIDYFTREDAPMTIVPSIPTDERDDVIGRIVADEIHDGDSLQVGIGGIPNALMKYLATKKHLGIHTELLSDGLIGLVQSGVADGSCKTLNKGKIVTSTIDGTQYAYDYVNNNPNVLVMEASYTNDYEILARNDNQVSVNTTLEIDLTGQCCSESLGSTQFSGTGGQAETAIGAQRAKNGRSFMVLHATANVKNEIGERVMISKIAPQLKAGSAVSLQRNDVQYVVTEYGMVNLRGKSIAERARLLISIAHPDFRTRLTEEAKALGLIK